MVRKSGNLLKTVLIGLFVLMGTHACKDDYESVVPYVYVRMSINPVNIIELNVPGGSYYIPNAGYGGIILFRDLIDSPNPFRAFDATCTHEISRTCRAEADGSGLAKCKCCSSEYILFGGNGSPTKGPAVEPLRQYRTDFVGGRITITN